MISTSTVVQCRTSWRCPLGKIPPYFYYINLLTNISLSLLSPSLSLPLLNPRAFAGFDARVTFVDGAGENIFVYAQMKVAPPTAVNSMTDVCKKAIINTLVHHLSTHGLRFDISKLFIVFYVWADMPDDIAQAIAQEALSDLSDYLTSKAAKLKLKQSEIDAILAYAKNYGNTNVHILGKARLDDWLIPTLKPIPRFVESINGISAKKGS